MRTRPRWLLLIFGALLVGMLFLFPMWWPLIVGEQPEIIFPGASAEEQPALETLHAINPTQAAATFLFGTPTVVPEEDQEMPEIEGIIIEARGDFVTLDELHWARGNATLYRDADGVYFVRFEDFEARNGPQLHVLLSIHPNPTNKEELHTGSGAIDLGVLQGSVGSQNYPVQDEVDLVLAQSEGDVTLVYKSVVVYSREIDVVFSFATLAPLE